MIWSETKQYFLEPFEKEKELEEAILEVKETLFGSSRIYLDTKKLIGVHGKMRNVPDGYLIDLTSRKEPKLYTVENELAAHDPLRHIAVQILQFSLSFETSPQRVKEVVKASLSHDQVGWKLCEKYAVENGFENIDYLLERIVFHSKAFNALVIIDEMPEELETILVSRFQFPVELISLSRYSTDDGERVYSFEPFLYDVTKTGTLEKVGYSDRMNPLDPSEIDTIVVPAREEGFMETFVGENRWYAIRIHSTMIPKIKYIAAYRVAPVSAITHLAPVASIEQWRDSNKYVLNFEEPAVEISPVKLLAGRRGKAPQAPRYTSLERLKTARELGEVF